MSDNAYARATAREARIWKPFGYSFPFTSDQIADRITIMGLYACSYLNKHKYLREVEAEDLTNLLADYNAKMADLATQEQIVVADIVGKRYLASIDKLIHDQKMITKQQGIDYDNALYDAKIAALEADRKALNTMSSKVASAIERNNARISELEAQIEIEGINYDLQEIDVAEKELQSGRVDISIANAGNDILQIQTRQVRAAADLVRKDVEKAEKELQSLKIDNAKLDVANEILRIQVETVEAASQLIDIDVRIASTRIDVAQTQRNIAKLGLLKDDFLIEQAKTAIEKAGIPISKARIRLAMAKYEDAVAEENYMTALLGKETENYQNRLYLKKAQYTSKAQSLEHRQEVQDAENALKIDLSNLSLLLAADDASHQAAIDNINVGEINQKPGLAWVRAYAAIAAAETAASAEITTALTHTIEKKA